MLISIEGNIGSGKSTFCNYLKEHFSKYDLVTDIGNNEHIFNVGEEVES